MKNMKNTKNTKYEHLRYEHLRYEHNILDINLLVHMNILSYLYSYSYELLDEQPFEY